MVKCESCGCKIPDHIAQFLKLKKCEMICHNCIQNQQFLEAEENERIRQEKEAER